MGANNLSNYMNIFSDEPELKSNPFKDQDPFIKSWEDLKTFDGLNTNFKRKTTRAEKAFGEVPRNNRGEISPAYEQSAGTYAMGQDGARTKQLNPGAVWRNGYGLFDVITPPYNLYELANFYDTNFANHAAIDAKVENMVGMGYLFEMTAETQIRIEDQEDEERVKRAKKRIERLKAQTRNWLESLNDEDGFINTMEKVLTDVQSTGNGYLEVGRKVNGEIGYVGHIPATTMRVRRLRDGFVQIIGGKVVYFRNYGATNPNPMTDDTRPNEVIHFKEYSPLNTFYGVPDIISAYTSLMGDQMAAQYNIDYFENKAVPRYVVITKGATLSGEAQDRMFRFLQTGLKGQNHRSLYVPLPSDSEGNKIEFEMKPIENGVQEASFEKYRKQNRDDILMAHQVPLSKLGGDEGGSIAAALVQDRTFKEQVARPAQRHIEKVLNKIIKEFTDIVELRFKELTLTDEVAQSQILERYIKTQVMLPNEARERLGLSQIPSGQEPFVMSPRQAADTRADVAGNRQRDADRSSNASDSDTATEGRNPAGEGRRAEQ
jgi:PBSX family phage portal protein